MADFEFKAPVNRSPVIRYVLTSVIILILLVILIWAIIHHFHKVSNTQPPAKSPNTSQGNSSGSGQNQGSTSPSGGATGSGNNPSSGASGSSSSGQSAQSSSNPQNQQLTNTGPGDVVALFAGATIVGGLGYRIYIRRRLARS